MKGKLRKVLPSSWMPGNPTSYLVCDINLIGIQVCSHPQALEMRLTSTLCSLGIVLIKALWALILRANDGEVVSHAIKELHKFYDAEKVCVKCPAMLFLSY